MNKKPLYLTDNSFKQQTPVRHFLNGEVRSIGEGKHRRGPGMLGGGCAEFLFFKMLLELSDHTSFSE